MIIGILQAGHARTPVREKFGDFTSLFQNMLSDRGFVFRTFDVVDMEFPAGPLECDGWLITGSMHGVYEELEFIDPLTDFIQAIYEADRPLVGVCFGHQIIAHALGGKVEKFKKGWVMGRQIYDWDGAKLALNAWHQDQVVEKPKDARLLGSSSTCQNAALVYGNKALTTQAHPEFNSAVMHAMVDMFRDQPELSDQLDIAQASLGEPVENAAMAETFTRFFKERLAP